jgi:DNA polymerase-4
MDIRKIIHVDMDAFYASVEQRDDPQLKGKPVIVAWKGNRSVVCAASYEARAFGVRSAMPALRAERMCPSAVFIAPDFTRYRAVSKSVREILERHTDLVEPLSLDEAYLDVTENKTGLPTATLVARMIREQIRQELNLTASAGVAPNKFLAKLASDWKKPDGLFVIQPEEVDAFLLSLSVGRLPGVGEVTEEKLGGLGIKTVSDLRGLDLSTLQHEFGRNGARLYELARVIDENAVVPDRPTRSISVEDCRHCRSAAVVQRFIHFSAHPQVMQQHRQLSRSRHDRSFLPVLPAALLSICPYFPVFSSPTATIEVGNTGKTSSEKAGVGRSTPIPVDLNRLNRPRPK